MLYSMYFPANSRYLSLDLANVAFAFVERLVLVKRDSLSVFLSSSPTFTNGFVDDTRRYVVNRLHAFLIAGLENRLKNTN